MMTGDDGAACSFLCARAYGKRYGRSVVSRHHRGTLDAGTALANTIPAPVGDGSYFCRLYRARPRWGPNASRGQPSARNYVYNVERSGSGSPRIT